MSETTVDRGNDKPTNGEERSPHPLDNVVVPEAPGDEAILHMRTGLFELGRNRARLSGTTTPVSEDVRHLEDHASAMARDTYREVFDPKQHAHDRMRLAEYENQVSQREEAQIGEAHATANLRDEETKLAKTPKAGEKPRANGWLVAAFIVAITITVAPTLHDFFFHTIADDLLVWFAASTSAAFVACMLTLAILSGRRSTWTWIGLVAGIILGLGLGAVRLSAAEGPAEMLFGVGLTVIEIAAVLLLEWLASGLRNSEDRWLPLKTAEDQAIAARDAAQADLTRWQARIKELNQAIAQKIAYVEDRFNRNLHLPELEAVAIKAVLDGYNAGITESVGRLRGATRRTV